MSSITLEIYTLLGEKGVAVDLGAPYNPPQTSTSDRVITGMVSIGSQEATEILISYRNGRDDIACLVDRTPLLENQVIEELVEGENVRTRLQIASLVVQALEQIVQRGLQEYLESGMSLEEVSNKVMKTTEDGYMLCGK